MAALLGVVGKRIDYLKVCQKCGLESDKWKKITEEAKKTILNTLVSYREDISVEIATALISCIAEDSTLLTDEDRQILIDSITSKTRHSDVGYVDYIDNQPAAAANVFARRSKQTLYNIENYLTHELWKGLREAHVNRQVVYTKITFLLVQLGLHRPREKFWGHLVGFIQWATEGSTANFRQMDRDMLKAKWNEARSTVNVDFDAPDEYPSTPAILMQTHPAIFRRAYEGMEHPILPPSTLDLGALAMLKSTTGCRSTKTQLHNNSTGRMERHRSTLETMLVFGKLCPQRLPSELY